MSTKLSLSLSSLFEWPAVLKISLQNQGMLIACMWLRPMAANGQKRIGECMNTSLWLIFLKMLHYSFNFV